MFVDNIAHLAHLAHLAHPARAAGQNSTYDGAAHLAASLASPDAGSGPTLFAAPINSPAPPVAYSAWVWVLGAVLLVLIIAWYIFVFRHTRRRPAPEPRGRSDRYATLREKTLGEVDSAEERYREGESDLRALHLDLNEILREFAGSRMQLDATSLTVDELARLEGTDRIVALLDGYQEPAFAADSDAQALAATNGAREVIRQW